MNEEQKMINMQKHIEGLRRENEILINIGIKKEMMLHKKSTQFRIMIGSFVAVLIFFGVWIYALYHANALLAADNQTKENWKRSAIELLGMNADLRMENEYVKHGMEEALEKGFIQKMPPPMVKGKV